MNWMVMESSDNQTELHVMKANNIQLSFIHLKIKKVCSTIPTLASTLLRNHIIIVFEFLQQKNLIPSLIISLPCSAMSLQMIK